MANSERFETVLSPDLARYVHAQVGHGALVSDSDVLREAVRQAAQLEAFQEAARKKIAVGVASLRAAKGVDGETFMAELDANLAAQERQTR